MDSGMGASAERRLANISPECEGAGEEGFLRLKALIIARMRVTDAFVESERRGEERGLASDDST
jgi:hypothetical protein